MSNFLLELFFEEIPALMQAEAEVGYKQNFTKYLQEKKINFDEIKVFSTPRRITVYIININSVIEQQVIEIKGPKTNASDDAINGFCRTHNIKQENLITKKIGDYAFYFYEKIIPSQKIEVILQQDLPEIIKQYVWSKSMYWGESEISAIRPLRNILCLLEDKIVPIKYGHLIANNITFGHRILGKQNITIHKVDEYFTVLANNFVILDANIRKKNINEQITQILTEHNLIIKHDENLLEEVVGLVEWPVVMLGKIKQKFMSLPKEILTTSMKNHQKYFNLMNKDGDFVPNFIFVSNIDVEDKNIIINGNERVLDARLNDALYFYNQDNNTTFCELEKKLSKMIFHIKLGSMSDKVNRIKKICNYLDKNNLDLELAAKLCKNDLASTVVNELPELQGVMGYYYALGNGYNNEVAEAIKNHYQPLGPNSKVPTGITGILALSDKIDSLVGLIIAGCMPTGSKDPFALRRLSLGIIRIIIENKLDIDLVKLLSFAIEQYGINDNKIASTIVLFLEERIKYFLKAQYDLNLINAVLSLYQTPNINLIIANIKTLSVFFSKEQSIEITPIYKRVNNILGKVNSGMEIKEDLFIMPEEQNLYKKFLEIEKQIENKSITELADKLKILTNLIDPINRFFEQVMINVKEVEIANNRLNLLYKIKQLFNRVIKFDEL